MAQMPDASPSLIETSVTRQMAALRIFAAIELPEHDRKKYKWELRPYGGSGFVGIISVTFRAKEIRQRYNWMAVPIGAGDYQIWRAYHAENINGLKAAITCALRDVRELLAFATIEIPQGCKVGEPMMHGTQPYRWCATHDRLMLMCEDLARA